ncbi:uncharacterized protein LOC125777733 [Bactrocera dorsalis]|uniref:Uncharacterized protein LOC125777733 n=1 Tax=Bactrocera dorsalis TaxID=27457 RepID=A0ABM3JIL1_BACDO|nr:uncharacterized protein LOC125777733 [Bactrocera dorsalis]
MCRKFSNDTLANVSPFLIKKVIDYTAGSEVETCKKLRNGNILIKTKNYNQAEKLVKLVSLSPTVHIEISEHTSLNLTKGVIHSNDLRGIKEEEILDELRNQNVTEVKKILKEENNDSLKEIGLIILTFSSISLPTEMSIGYEKIKIRPYIPLPLRCKKCQRYGHIEKICKNAKICPNCANEFHTSEDNAECVNIKSFVNCKENGIQTYNHNSYDQKCPIFVREKEIQVIITLEKVDRRKAISTYKERNQYSGPSYSAVTRNNSALYSQTQESPAQSSTVTKPINQQRQ